MTTTNSPTQSRRWLYLRRTSQIAFFLLFLLLFLKAEYGGQDELAWPVDLFFRFDPLILAANLLTLSPLVWGLLWSLVFVGLTLVLGRFFCGWICPLGTTLDGCRRLLFSPRPDSGVARRWRRFKYYLLFFLLAGASTYYALHKRSGTEYLRERLKRLFLPLIFGTLVLIPPLSYLGLLNHSDYSQSFIT